MDRTIMAVLDKIGSFLKNTFNRAKRSLSSLINVGGLEVYASIDASKAITEGFNKNTAIYSIIMTDAEKFGTIPRYVFDKKVMQEKGLNGKVQFKALGDNVIAGKLNDLINRPNEYQSQDSFYTAVRAFYKVCGEGMIWLNRFGWEEGMDQKEAEKLEVLEMYVLPPNHVTVVPDPENIWGALDYILDVSGSRIKLGKANVIHWRSTNLNWDATSRPQLRGFPALTPGEKTLQQNIDATRASVRQYQNDGAKGVLTNETFNSLTPTQDSQITDVINAKLNNYDVKGSIAMLQGKWAYYNILSGIDTKLNEGKEMTWKELCFLFGIPYEFFDSQVTYENKQHAQIGWVSNKIIPASKQLDGEMNRILLKAFGLEGKAFIGCDYWELPEMQQVRNEAAQGLMKLWPITPDEVREELGYEAIGGEMSEPWVPSNFQPLSVMKDGFNMEQMTQELVNQNIGKDDPGK